MRSVLWFKLPPMAWPSPDSSLLNISALPCQTHKLFSGILDRLPTFSHLSSVSFPVSKLPLLFPPPISLLIIPSISFSTLSPFLLSCPAVRSLSVVIHLSWLQQLLPLRSCGHFPITTAGYWHRTKSWNRWSQEAAGLRVEWMNLSYRAELHCTKPLQLRTVKGNPFQSKASILSRQATIKTFTSALIRLRDT